MDDQPEPGPPPSDPFATTTAARRLRELLTPRLRTGEEPLAWARAWISRDSRYPWLQARTFDFLVLTDRRLMLWSSGFFSRQPRRRVLTDRLDDLTAVEAVGRHPRRTLRVKALGRKPLLFELLDEAPTYHFVEMLVAHAPATAQIVRPPTNEEPT
jgi:hypothetical protein